ncbi:rifin [Plasmodium falciparum RAJ116]|uniref:Rifin n=1 Tax=Plasmodium falciparum RAJ116 TaxID=580058 RepID=A0A0L0D0A9_PLAFA|nr:rifin [Plasmodium falciparum RAJ116]
MKFNYINISLFSLSLYVLLLSSEVYNQRNHYITLHTPNTKTTKPHRLLCECELYEPSNYDNDPEMKAVMQDFDLQISQRFKEYDERMMENRKKCKEQCDKDIQKIILKDKIEKELTEKFLTLQTDISTNSTPTCVCEKSLGDKVEKGCLRCGGILSTAFPEFGLIGGTLVHSAAVNAATKIGMKAALDGLEIVNGLKLLLKEKITHLVTTTNFNCKDALLESIEAITTPLCKSDQADKSIYCLVKSGTQGMKFSNIESKISDAAEAAGNAANAKYAEMTSVGTIFSDPIVISAIVVATIAKKKKNEEKTPNI